MRPPRRPPVVPLRLDVVLLLVADVAFDVAHVVLVVLLVAVILAAAIASSDGPAGWLDPRSYLLLLDPAKVFGTFQFAIPLDESLGVVMDRLVALGGVAVDACGFVGSVVGEVGFAAVVVVAFVSTGEERNGCVVVCWDGFAQEPFGGGSSDQKVES